MRYTIPVLGISIVFLLIFASGCIGQSNSDLLNMSNGSPGTQTPVTIIPTGSKSPGSTEIPATPVSTGPVDVCVFGSKNCHFYEQCMTGCVGSGMSEVYCAKNVCCSSKCMDLPPQDGKVACVRQCLAEADTPQPTPVPPFTTETLADLGPQTPIPW